MQKSLSLYNLVVCIFLGLLAGLVPVSDPFPEGDLPEVELIVEDTSKFEDTTSSNPKPTQDDNSDLYKLKVSTWGVFPRPSNISKTLKSECDQALKDGDSLMNIGKLKEALPYYEKVMDKLAFQSELHGLAALQWSICLDSLSGQMRLELCMRGFRLTQMP
uniref:Uncharacterized protein n=1 Tax=Vitis vinifera TaxID=29760 RepID=F6HVF8_VITVI